MNNELPELIERVRNNIEAHRKDLPEDWQDFIAEQVCDLNAALAYARAAVEQAGGGEVKLESHWLLELFLPMGGNSLGFYHTGFCDIGGHSRTTRNPHEARKYATKEDAESASKNLFSLQGVWTAINHGFYADTAPSTATANAGGGEVVTEINRLIALYEAPEVSDEPPTEHDLGYEQACADFVQQLRPIAARLSEQPTASAGVTEAVMAAMDEAYDLSPHSDMIDSCSHRIPVEAYHMGFKDCREAVEAALSAAKGEV